MDKGWPKGRRRHETPDDWNEIKLGIRRAGKLRISELIARRVGVHSTTLWGWASGRNIPSPRYVPLLRKALNWMDS